MVRIWFSCVMFIVGWTQAHTVVIASRGQQKVRAVEAVCDRIQKATGEPYACYAVTANSGVPVQPVGYQAARTGAYNRLSNIPAELQQTASYMIAIENYITQTEDGSWYDVGLVVCNDHQRTHEVCTRATYIPQAYVRAAYARADHVTDSGISYTVGAAIADTLAPRFVDPRDWHQEPEFGGVSRQTLLEQAVFSMMHADQIVQLRNHLVVHHDFPKPGIAFADCMPIMQRPEAFAMCIQLMARQVIDMHIDAVVGLEARGFIVGAALARELGVGFVPVRKAGKLPGDTRISYFAKEYGYDAFEIADNAIAPGDRVVLIDDIIATGGSAQAAIHLLEQVGADPIAFLALCHVTKAQLSSAVPIVTLLDK